MPSRWTTAYGISCRGSSWWKRVRPINQVRLSPHKIFCNHKEVSMVLFLSFLFSFSPVVISFFSASRLLSFTSSKLKTRPSYWWPVSWARCFFCVLAARSSVLVLFETNLPALRRRVGLGESKVWSWKSDTGSSTSLLWYWRGWEVFDQQKTGFVMTYSSWD